MAIEGYRGVFGEEPGGMEQEALPGPAQPEAPVDSGSLNQFPPLVIEQIKYDEKEVLKEVAKWYSQDIGSSYRRNFLKRCEEYHQAYLGYMPPTSFPWSDSSNVDLGIIEMAVDNIKSRFKMSTIGGKPAFAAIPASLGAELLRRDVQELMSAALDQQVDIEKKADVISQNTVELGNCIVKRRWKKEKKNVRIFEKEVIPIKFRAPFMNMFSQNMERISIGIKEVTEEGAEVDICNLEDILVPENSPEDPQKMHHIMHLFELSENDLDVLKATDPSYDLGRIDELKEFLRPSTPNKDNPKRDAKITQASPETKLKCAEIYCKWKHDGSSFAEEVIFTWAIEAKRIIRAIRLIDIYFDGLRPFRWFRYKSSGSVYGRGVVEMLYPYRTALNTIFNMSVNCMMLQILPWGFYRYGSSFKPEDHKLAPGVWIPLDDINDARPAQFPPTARLADSSIMLLISLVERQSGISAPHMGQQTSGRKTAFEIKAVISEGNIKHEERIDNFQDTFGDLLRDIYNLYKFNLPDNAVFRKLYDDSGVEMKTPIFFKPASRYIISQYDFDFIILGSLTTGNKAIEREDALGLADWLLRLPIVGENPDAQFELAKDVVQAFGKRDINRYLPPKEVTKLLKGMKVKELIEMATGKREAGGGGGRPPIPGRG